MSTFLGDEKDAGDVVRFHPTLLRRALIKAHRLLYCSNISSRVIEKEKNPTPPRLKYEYESETWEGSTVVHSPV